MVVCKSSGIKWFLLKVAALFRRFLYSPILYAFLYVFWFSKVVKRLEKESLGKYLGKFPEDLSLNVFEDAMRGFEWLPEKKSGALDFTYLNSALFVSDEMAQEFGRDCDDFAHQWFKYFSSKGYYEVYNILLTTWGYGTTFKKSHIIAIGRRDSEGAGSEFFLMDNRKVYKDLTGKSSVGEVMQWYADKRARLGTGYDNTVWCYYRKFRNY